MEPESDEDPDPDDELELDGGVEPDEDVVEDPDVDDEEMNGFEESPPVACVKSKVKVPTLSCTEMVSDMSVESRAFPDLEAQIQLLDASVGSILPPLQDRQLSQRMFAVMIPLLIPVPSRRVTWAAEL